VQREGFDATLKRVKDLRLYDTISSGYVPTRRADPRIARCHLEQLDVGYRLITAHT
jgi:hypothetical protein